MKFTMKNVKTNNVLKLTLKILFTNGIKYR